MTRVKPKHVTGEFSLHTDDAEAVVVVATVAGPEFALTTTAPTTLANTAAAIMAGRQ